MNRPIFQAVSWPVLLRAALIALAGLWIYHPSLHGDWLWDDDVLITRNPLRYDSWGLWKIWFSPGVLVDYYPITFTVMRLEWDLWGMNPLGYHVLTVCLHLVNALLVWRLLGKFGLRLAWLGGLIFAIHPAQVESVAWVAEQKNTLSLLPLLLAMCAWIDYAERKNARDYRIALVLFLVAILCKTTVVMFPVVILLHAWWKRGRMEWTDLKETAPFFFLSLAFGLMSVWLNPPSLGTEIYLPFVPLGGFLSRTACAGVLIAVYFSHCFLPWNLMPAYPHWNFDPPTLPQFLPWLVIAGGIGWSWMKRQTWGRHALLGLLFFLIFIGPFCGFLWVPHMRFTWVMDHFLYIPIIGLIGLVVAGLEKINAGLFPLGRYCVAGIVALVLALLAWESHVYAAQFIDQETIWTYTIQRNPSCWLAYNNLGLVMLQRGQAKEAAGEFEHALQINPQLIAPHINWANALVLEGQLQEGLDQYQQALRMKPNDASIENYMGNALSSKGRFDDAMKAYRETLRMDPNNVDAHIDLGLILIQTGRLSEGMEEYQMAVRMGPDNALAHYNLGIALGQEGDMRGAVEQFELAAKLNPVDAKTRYNLAVALVSVGRMQEAMEQCQEALRFDPNSASAQRLLLQLRRQKTSL